MMRNIETFTFRN